MKTKLLARGDLGARLRSRDGELTKYGKAGTGKYRPKASFGGSKS
mgnify:CR=1 FL=1